MDKACSVDGCEKKMEARGWCHTHYMRWRIHGDPTTLLPRGGGRPKLATSCRIEGCDRPGPYVRALCKLHYTRWDLHGDPLWEPTVFVRPPCAVEGCERDAYARALCLMHYYRLLQFGDPGEAAPRRAAAGEGHTQPDGYRKITVNGKKVKEHRHVMETVLGRPLLPEETVHHLNGVKDDNSPENLELWVSAHLKGQRVTDLVAFVVANYPELVVEAQREVEGTATG